VIAVGLGTFLIVVQFPNGDMQAFEPCELEKVPARRCAVAGPPNSSSCFRQLV
jgi:hypothetical protein